MPPAPLTTIHQHFAGLDDPRVERTKDHQLLDILTIALCAVLCGADSWVECEAFGHGQAGLAAHLPGPAQRHPVARHLRPGLRRPRPGPVPAGLPAAGSRPAPRVAGLAGQRDRPRGARRQDAAPLPRPRRRQGRPAPGQRLGQRPTGWCWARSPSTTSRTRSPPSRCCSSCWPWRGCIVDDRRDGLPDGDRGRDRRAGRRLRAGAQGQPGHAAPARSRPSSPRRGRPASPASPTTPTGRSRRATGGSRSAAAGRSTTRSTWPT